MKLVTHQTFDLSGDLTYHNCHHEDYFENTLKERLCRPEWGPRLSIMKLLRLVVTSYEMMKFLTIESNNPKNQSDPSIKSSMRQHLQLLSPGRPSAGGPRMDR